MPFLVLLFIEEKVKPNISYYEFTCLLLSIMAIIEERSYLSQRLLLTWELQGRQWRANLILMH